MHQSTLSMRHHAPQDWGADVPIIPSTSTNAHNIQYATCQGLHTLSYKPYTATINSLGRMPRAKTSQGAEPAGRRTSSPQPAAT